MRQWVAAAAFLSGSLSASAQDSLVSIGDQKYLTGDYSDAKIKQLKYPTLGCPSIVKAGAAGQAWVKLGDSGTTTGFELAITPTRDAAPTYALPVTGSSFDSTTGIYKLTYSVPSDVPADTYDLTVSVPSLAVTDRQYNCLRVVKQETGTYTFFVVADSHFNNPTGFWDPGNLNSGSYNAITIIEQTKRELRALNPTFAIVCGDIMFGLDYDYEYEGIWNIWKDTGVPLFFTPGNHDGISCLEERSFLGITSPVRDGLDYWRRYLGPCYYSFQFGGLHFQAVNSMDGTPERRDGFLIVIENYGGDLLSEQMDWIAADLASASGTVVPFMHHNPLGPYRENGPFGMWTWVLNRIWEWITTGNFDDYSQEWNTQATGQFLLQQYANVPLAFIGHSHLDAVDLYNGTTYRTVTTAGAGGTGYWGYAPVQVENSQIVEHIYLNDEFRSVPSGNLHVSITDSEGSIQKAEVKSGLAKPFEVTIEFLMPSAGAYAATNGTVVQFAAVDGSTSRVWVKASTPVAPDLNSPATLEVTCTTSSTGGSTEPGSSAGGPACGLLGIEALLLALLLARRRVS